MWKKTTKKEKNVDFFQEKVGNPVAEAWHMFIIKKDIV